MKKFLIASGVAVLAFASVAAAQTTFVNNLTVGSTGAEVTALQTVLVNGGYLVMPSGVAMGYFGSRTKAAVQAYQAKNNIPATGFVGPLTKASLNGGATVATVPAGWTCPVGMTCTVNPTTTTPATPGSTVITTPGLEGTLSATQTNSGLASTVYEGGSMVGILGVKVEAKNSDIAVQRVKLRMDELTNGSDTKFYNKIFKKLYVTDGTNVLASADLNTSTVVKDGSNYYITIAGFNLVVPRGSSRNIIIKADVYPTIDTTDYNDESYQIGFAQNGIRGVDGAGIDQYAGGASDNSIARTASVSADLADTATLKISTNSATPKASDVIATAGSNENEYDKLAVLNVDLKAEKDNVTITDLSIDVTKAGAGAATASTTVYLFDGSTELDSSPVSNGTATFPDVNFVLNRDTTKTLTVKVDIRNANGVVSQIAADVDTADVTAENSRGDSVSVSGSAQGETFSIRNIGPQFALTAKSATRSTVSSNDTSGVATSTGTGKFSLTITAVGGDISFGTTGSTTPAFSTTSTTVASVYKNGSSNGTVAANSLGGTSALVSYSTPSSGVTTSGQTWTIAEGNSVTLDVDYQITVSGSSANNYAFQLNGINWYNPTTGQQTSTSMTDKSEWRTSTVSLP